MCHVLIIEDEWLIAEHLTESRRTGGRHVDRDGLHRGRGRPGGARAEPAIILSDVMLLAGTGPRAVRTIMSALEKIPVIFITGTPDACQPCEPPAVILHKPIDPARLMATFRRLAPP